MLVPIGAAVRRLARRVCRGPGALVVVLVCALPLLPLALVPGAERNRLATSLLMVGLGLSVLRFAPRYRVAAMAIGVLASVRYLWWRATETLYLDVWPDAGLSLLLLGTELFGFFVLLGGLFQTALRRERRPIPLGRWGPEQWPSVDVMVPTYNEGVDILRRTLSGVTALAYPNRRIYLLDDGKRPEVAALAAEMGVAYLTRPDNSGAKAGNLNHALARTSGDLVAVFDADHVPVRTFLDTTVGFFLADPKVALVQTPHHFYNPDPFERNLRHAGRVPPEQAFFYHTVQKGSDFWNAAFFCGSCAVLRRSAVVALGGIAQETVTEDAHTAMRLHGAGWKSVYLDLPQAAGLATERFAWHVAQRMRWTRGMVQILRLDNPLLARGLTLPQRLCYLIAAAHFLYGAPRLVYLMAPAAYLLFGLHPLLASASDLVVLALPHLVLAGAVSAAMNGNTRHSFWPEVYETAMAPWAAAVALVTLVAPRRGKFNVTPKGAPLGAAHLDRGRVLPLVVLLGVSVAGAVLTPIRLQAHPETWADLALAFAWNAYNLVVLLAAVVVCFEPAERRAAPRLTTKARVLAFDPDGDTPLAEGRILDLAEGGARIVFPRGTVLPAVLDVTVVTEGGTTRVDRAAVLDAHAADAPEEGALEVGLRFPALAPHTHQALLERLYGEPDTWLHDRYVPDHPARAALAVLIAPWRVLRAFLSGRPAPRAVRAEAVTRGAALGPWAPTPAAPPGSTLMPLLALAAGIFVAVRPPIFGQVPVEEAGAAPLLAAHHELDRLYTEARLSVWTASSPTPRFEKRLWALAWALDDGGVPGLAAAIPLRAAHAGLLASAAALAAGESAASVSAQLDHVADDLAAAESGLVSVSVTARNTR
ncbi:MAG: glycosyltransferase [Pseudomonadota bacterium]|nr:glycosyltransferase [Pseudomonadota bacterium]